MYNSIDKEISKTPPKQEEYLIKPSEQKGKRADGAGSTDESNSENANNEVSSGAIDSTTQVLTLPFSRALVCNYRNDAYFLF